MDTLGAYLQQFVSKLITMQPLQYFTVLKLVKTGFKFRRTLRLQAMSYNWTGDVAEASRWMVLRGDRFYCTRQSTATKSLCVSHLFALPKFHNDCTPTSLPINTSATAAKFDRNARKILTHWHVDTQPRIYFNILQPRRSIVGVGKYNT